MREKINLNRQSSRQHGHAKNQKAHAAIEKHAAHHEERGQQREAGVKEEHESDLRQGMGHKAGDRVYPPVIIEFPDVVETPHHLVPVIRFRPWTLPNIIRSNRIRIAIDRVRRSQWISKCAIVVITHPRHRGHTKRQRHGGQPRQRSGAGPILALPHPAAEHNSNRQTKQNALVWPRKDENRDSDAHQQCIAEPGCPYKSRKTAENQRSAERPQRTRRVIGVGPVAENPQAQDGDHPA